MIKLTDGKKTYKLKPQDISLLYNCVATKHNSVINNLPGGTRMGLCEEEKLAHRLANLLDMLREL